MVDLSQLRAALAYLVKEFGPTPEWPNGDPEWTELRPLAKAARLFLAEREGGQKVWWCDRHRSVGSTLRCDGAELRISAGLIVLTPCQMVEAWLTAEPPEEPPKDPWDYDP